jgi:hypothetical protein
MTVAVDVILSGIDEPVRFKLESKARIFQQYERFWYVTRKAVAERYFLTIKMDSPSASGDVISDTGSPFKVVRFESIAERERSLTRLSFGGRSPTKMPTQLIHPADDDESDSDEPLLSGSGEVNRICPDDVLQEWQTIIEKWKNEPEKRPAEMYTLIHDGIPDVLRGEVWQLLTKVYADPELVQTYHMLLEKESPCEQVILRDIHRTFPAHDYFKESNGIGQEALYKISKAYSLYDEEVSYCQGLSFLAAALLLHMPEEQAFCVLIKIMFDYGLRDLFKLGFDALHLRFYQLQRLIEDYAPDLFNHFYAIGVETHMYASQWFLTLFTAKFPLQMVFFIVDLFLSEGVNTIFHISLALLQDSKKELLQLDFEGVLKYFRVALPRRYRTETSAKDLIHSAVKLRISHKRLSKYEKEYISLKQRELESLDPMERLERENIRLKETILRLERENDDLAHELVTSKIELRNKLDTTEDQLESTVVAVERKVRECQDLEEEARSLREESDILKGKCRLEVDRLEQELTKTRDLVRQYKKICRRLEEQADKFEDQKQAVINRAAKCDHCADVVEKWVEESPRHRRSNGMASPRGQHSPNSPEPPPSLNGWSKTKSNGAVHMVDLMEKLEEREEHIRQVELELAQTKLALVEAQCQNQDLTHQMSTSVNTDVDGRPAWLKKTISSIREVGTSLKQQGHERSNSNVSHTSIDR